LLPQSRAIDGPLAAFFIKVGQVKAARGYFLITNVARTCRSRDAASNGASFAHA
jgi:hypothetical protein